jgi:hypothetical protein
MIHFLQNKHPILILIFYNGMFSLINGNVLVQLPFGVISGTGGDIRR